ncbi:MAG: exosortase-associated EpsI family protein [Planctomycetes bacterium]|nr:exosortase-associated EpsI family protein [Planctomycetota bacterium]
MTAGLLPALAIMFPNSTRVDSATLIKLEAVRQAVMAVPYRVGRWTSIKIDIPVAAIELLHPNAILSRRFEPIDGGPSITLLLVHCTDARDMGGHYPPKCYPSAGWKLVSSRRDSLTLKDKDLPVAVYTFSRFSEIGIENRIRILNTFVLPDGSLTPELDDISKLADRVNVASLGVAQLQIVSSLTVSDETALSEANELLEALPGLLRALDVWKEGDDDA